MALITNVVVDHYLGQLKIRLIRHYCQCLFSHLLIESMVSTALSGFTDMLVIPAPTSAFVTSGKSDGACPQMPMGIPNFFDFATAYFIYESTASFRSSPTSETISESRSRPNVSCVKSFEPIENPSKYFANSSIKITFEGISTIIYTY